MSESLKHIRVLLLRLGIVILAFTLCRVLFLIFNASHFDDVTSWVFIGGLHFDIATVFLLNGPLIILHLLPVPFRETNWYQVFLKVIFFIINLLLIGFNLADIEYFKFTFKRSTADLLHLMTLGDDVGNLLPTFLSDYWYLVLFLILIGLGMNWLYRKIRVTASGVKKGGRYYLFQIALFFIGLGISVVIARGGLQYKPLNIINASEYATTDNIPLVLNTPFAIAKTLGETSLEEAKYFSKQESKKHFDPVLNITSDKEMRPNVVILILESFSEEYIGAINKSGETYTPFLDSLILQSIRFEAGYANGRKSIEAMPAIVSGLPALMNTPYIQSAYSGNTVTSLPKILSGKGYTSSFYHGGNNGTMGFNAFADAAGFDRYIGRSEYPHQGDYDGKWGIFDEPFLQFFAKEMNREKEPFFSCMFSLSSHHPFSIPEKYKDRFDKGERPIQNSISYTDFALRQFFESARQMDWFENTWFVITADHTTITENEFYQSRLGGYRIPLFFYHPLKEAEMRPGVVQHTDILPSVLQLTGFNERIARFGYNVFTENERYAFGYLNNTYHIIDEKYMLEFDGTETTAIYHIKNDPLLERNLLDEGVEKKEMAATLKAVIQEFNHRMISNKLTFQ